MIVAGPGWVCGLALVLLVAGATGAIVAGSGQPSTRVATGVALSTDAERSPLPLTQLPPSLQASWAARSGFDAALAESGVSAAPESGTVLVSLTLWPSSASFFEALPAGTSPKSPAEIGAQFGLSQGAYSGLEQYFTSRGLSIVHAWPDRLGLTITGPAPQVGSAFGTSLSTEKWSGRTVDFPDQVPQLPPPYASEVAAVSGLSSGLSTFSLPLGLKGPPAAVAVQPGQGRTTSMVMPADARLAYGLTDLYNFTGTPEYATGEGVALLLWGWGYDPADLSTFFANYFGASYPVPQVSAYPVDGAPAPSANAVNDPSGAPMELTLDLEWSGTMAPGASLDAVYAPDGPDPSNDYSPTDATLEDALNEAVNQVAGVRVISMSFGGNDGNDSSFQAAFSTSFAAATQQGITLVAASGDNGGTQGASCSGAPAPQFPASSPQVLAVGGTAPVFSETPLGQVTGIDSDAAWNLSGGGFSVAYGAPSWQLVGTSADPVSAAGHRGIPDVAGPAADNFLYYRGQGEWAQGTSFAAPMWAGLIAEMDALRGAPLGFLNPRLYSLAAAGTGSAAGSGLSDITTGGNCLGPAASGWDTATGLGSPRAKALYAEISYTFADVRLSGVPSSAAPGSAVSAEIEILNASSLAPLPGLPVLVVLEGTSYSGPCGGSFGSTTVTTNATGEASARLSIPSCYLGTHATLTATVLSGGYFGENSSGLTVNLLGLAGFLAFTQYFPYNVLVFTLIICLAVVIGWRLGRRRRRTPFGQAPTPNAPGG